MMDMAEYANDPRVFLVFPYPSVLNFGIYARYFENWIWRFLLYLKRQKTLANARTRSKQRGALDIIDERHDSIQFSIDTRNNRIWYLFSTIYRFDFEIAITRNESLFKGEMSFEIASRVSSLRMFRYFLGTPCAHVYV